MTLLKKFLHLLKVLAFGLMKMLNNPMLAFQYDIEMRLNILLKSKEIYSKSEASLDSAKNALEELNKEVKAIETILEAKKIDITQAKIKAHRLLCLRNREKELTESITALASRLEGDLQKMIDLMLDIESKKMRLSTYKERRELSICRGNLQELNKTLTHNNTEKELKDSLRFEEHRQDSTDKLEETLGTTNKGTVEQQEISDLLSEYNYIES